MPRSPHYHVLGRPPLVCLLPPVFLATEYFAFPTKATSSSLRPLSGTPYSIVGEERNRMTRRVCPLNCSFLEHKVTLAVVGLSMTLRSQLQSPTATCIASSFTTSLNLVVQFSSKNTLLLLFILTRHDITWKSVRKPVFPDVSVWPIAFISQPRAVNSSLRIITSGQSQVIPLGPTPWRAFTGDKFSIQQTADRADGTIKL